MILLCSTKNGGAFTLKYFIVYWIIYTLHVYLHSVTYRHLFTCVYDHQTCLYIWPSNKTMCRANMSVYGQ